jgi:hypothetical protein
VLDHVQPVTPALKVMALAGNVISQGLAILLPKLGLAPTDPAQARNDGQPDCVLMESQRRGHAHAAVRRVNAHMEVLDVLVDDLNGYAAHINAMPPSNHAGS